AMQAMMTARTPDDAQGELQGAIASLFSIASITGPLVMSQAFSKSTDAVGFYFPGAPFVVATGITTLSLIAFRVAASKKGA
ncbi:MAG: tetracycline resistance MFS efflux pump, partial [Pseudomonadota bacterium]